jgi:hypothetical protein
MLIKYFFAICMLYSDSLVSYGQIQILLRFPAHIYHKLLIELMPLNHYILYLYSSQLRYISYVYILLLILPDFKHTTPIPLNEIFKEPRNCQVINSQFIGLSCSFYLKEMLHFRHHRTWSLTP